MNATIIIHIPFRNRTDILTHYPHRQNAAWFMAMTEAFDCLRVCSATIRKLSSKQRFNKERAAHTEVLIIKVAIYRLMWTYRTLTSCLFAFRRWFSVYPHIIPPNMFATSTPSLCSLCPYCLLTQTGGSRLSFDLQPQRVDKMAIIRLLAACFVVYVNFTVVAYSSITVK